MKSLLALLLLVLSATGQASATGQTSAGDPVPPEATLDYMNREIMVFRGVLAGAPPAVRVARAGRRLAEHEVSGEGEKLRQVPVAIGNQQGIGIQLNDVLLFTVLPEDLDPEDTRPLQALAEEVQSALREALDARHAQADVPNLVRALLFSVLALVLAVLAAWLLIRLRNWLLARLQQEVVREASTQRPWLGYLTRVLERIVQLLALFAIVVVAYLWLAWALGQFPLTRPLSARLAGFLIDLLGGFAGAAAAAIPDIIALAVILLITHALAQSVRALFDAVQQGRIELPGVYRETVGATRRIVTVVIWALGFTFAWPYIPGSQSDVFKGLSVLFGAMLTLGSSGIVSQVMSGMTLIYSRALRRGEMVQIGETTGIVQEVGALSTKLLNVYNEEVTIPNAVVVANQIHNLSRTGMGAMLATRLTIGYDAPWRQVEAMLLNAARATTGLRSEPRVLQRNLADFYVEYELLVTLEDPLQRPFVLSRLHAAIQDEFNRHGVQIMSPNFRMQPPGGPVVVPEADWYRAPARRED